MLFIVRTFKGDLIAFKVDIIRMEDYSTVTNIIIIALHTPA